MCLGHIMLGMHQIRCLQLEKEVWLSTFIPLCHTFTAWCQKEMEFSRKIAQRKSSEFLICKHTCVIQDF